MYFTLQDISDQFRIQVGIKLGYMLCKFGVELGIHPGEIGVNFWLVFWGSALVWEPWALTLGTLSPNPGNPEP